MLLRPRRDTKRKLVRITRKIVQQHLPSLALRNFLSKLMIAQLYEAALERMFKRYALPEVL